MVFSFPFLFLFFQFLVISCNSLSNKHNPFKKINRSLFIRDSRVNFLNFRKNVSDSSVLMSSELESPPETPIDYDDMTKKIKMLRTTTGRGTQECFNALNEAKGDVRIASQILMNALIGKKDKDGGSESEVVTCLEGTIAVSCSPKACSIIDLRCDTDFVGKNKLFTSLAKSFANAALESMLDSPGYTRPLDELKTDVLGRKCMRCGTTLSQTGTMVKGALRETVAVARIGFLESNPDEFFVFYVHSTTDPKNSQSFCGPAASVISFGLDEASPESFYSFFEEPIQTSDTNCCMLGIPCIYSNLKNITDFHDKPELDDVRKFLRQIAIHVVAEKPKEITIEQFDKNALEESKKEYESLLSTGKPADIVDRIVKGKLKKKFSETVMMEQTFTFGNGNNSVSQALESMSKKLSKNIKLNKFITYAISDDLINFKHPQNCTFYNTNIKF